MATLGKRCRQPSSKLRETLEEINPLDENRTVIVKCAQTGEFRKVKIATLLKPNLIPISKNDFNERADLLLSDHGKEYPVQFVSFCEKRKSSKSSSACALEHAAAAEDRELLVVESQAGGLLMSGKSEEADSLGKKKSCRMNKKVLKTVSEVLKRAKGTAVLQADHVLAERQASKSQLRGESEEPGPSSMSGRRVLGNGLKKAKELQAGYGRSSEPSPLRQTGHSIPAPLETRLQSIENELKEIKNILLKEHCQDGSDGIDLSQINTETPYTTALGLLDAMFTKEELSKSLVFQSKRSSKPALPKERMKRLIDCVKKRFGPNSLDIKILKRKCNQKCREASRNLKKIDQLRSIQNSENEHSEGENDNTSTLEDNEEQSTSSSSETEIGDLGQE